MLEAISDLTEGKLTHPVIDALYCKIELLQRDLEKDDEAMNWFNLSSSSLHCRSVFFFFDF